MNEYMLINFQRIMVFLRCDIKDRRSIDILCILMKAFDGLINNEEMCDEIVKIMPDWKAQLIYARYEYCFIQQEIIEFMKIAVQIMVYISCLIFACVQVYTFCYLKFLL